MNSNRETRTAYNALPLEVRDICSKVLLEHQIRDLHIERDRTIAYHKAHLREIDQHITNCTNDLAKMTTQPPL